MYVLDPGNLRVRAINRKTDTVSTVAGSGEEGHKDGPALQAQFHDPYSMLYREGSLLVSEYSTHCIRRVQLSAGKHWLC